MCCRATSSWTRVSGPPLARGRFAGMGGFSLVEIMVVVVIIGLLAGLVTINVRGRLVDARQSAARSDIATICDALETFYMLHNRYPSNEEDLQILTEGTERSAESILQGHSLRDPWDNPYQYNQPGRDGPYDVFSLGADGRDGGEGADADIGSWQIRGRSER